MTNEVNKKKKMKFKRDTLAANIVAFLEIFIFNIIYFKKY